MVLFNLIVGSKVKKGKVNEDTRLVPTKPIVHGKFLNPLLFHTSHILQTTIRQ